MHNLTDKYHAFLMYDELEEYEEIIDDLSQFIKKNPEHSIAYHNRGVAYWESGEKKKARKDFDRAVELDQNSTIYFSRAQFLQTEGKIEEAEKDFQRAVDLSPNDPLSFRMRGTFYEEIKEWDKAITDYTKAINLAPEFGYTYKKRAEVYKKKGEKVACEADMKAWKKCEKEEKEKRKAIKEKVEKFICPDTGKPFRRGSWVGECSVEKDGSSLGPILQNGQYYYRFTWDGDYVGKD